MTEQEFYKMCEKIENAQLPSGIGNYYPTVEELKESISGKPTEAFLPVLLFYASNPFPSVEECSYKDTVRYARELTGKVTLE